MTKLILVRHGQSTANVEHTFAGSTDAQLSELGLMQANKTAEYIAENYKPDIVYASDLDRAFITGKTCAEKCGIEIIKAPNMREIEGGEWEKAYFPDLPVKYPEQYELWKNCIGRCVCPGGESVADLRERIKKEVTRIASENIGKTVVIATHATPIRVFVSFCLGLSLDMIQDVPWAPNASVTEVDFENGAFTLIKSGYDEHLSGLSSTLPKTI